MKRLAIFASVIALAATLGAVTSDAFADDACGTRANPCPLQKWMHQKMGSNLADGKLAEVAAGFDALATMSPDPTWTDWTKLSKEGAGAARKGGDEGTRGSKAACKGCHDHYKTLYRSRYRTRPI